MEKADSSTSNLYDPDEDSHGSIQVGTILAIVLEVIHIARTMQ